MKFEPWTPEDCSGKPFRLWECLACGRREILAYQWCPTRCDCQSSADIVCLCEIHDGLVVWDEVRISVG